MIYTVFSAFCVLSLTPTIRAANPLPPSIPANTTHIGWVNEPNSGRGTEAIIWQCLTTIFLCVYVGVHLNVPAVRLSLKQSVARKSSWVVIGLLLPECVCFTALLQWAEAKAAATRCKGLCNQISLRQAFLITTGGLGVRNLHQLRESNSKSPMGSQHLSAAGGVSGSDTLLDGSHSADEAQKDGTIWIYGPYFDRGFKAYMKWHPPSEEYLSLIATLVPSDEEINARSKADGLAKALTAFQTLWTLTQITSRAAQRLDISLLEFATIGYVLLAVSSCCLWFKKPYDIGSPLIIDVDLASENIDRRVNLSAWCTKRELSWDRLDNLDRILSFEWSGSAADTPFGFPSTRWFCALFCALFGGAHCLAWTYIFSTGTEAWLWRTLSLLTIFLPILFTASIVIGPESSFYEGHIKTPLAAAFGLMYLLSRIYMIIECFLAFRDAPVGIYRKVSWTGYLGHFGV